MAQELELDLSMLGGGGPLEPGNITLAGRKAVPTPEGEPGTVRSMSFEDDGVEVLVPTIVNGAVVSDDEAVAHYRSTGEHLGKFNTPQEATTFAQQLSEDYRTGVIPSGSFSLDLSMFGPAVEPAPAPPTGDIIDRGLAGMAAERQRQPAEPEGLVGGIAGLVADPIGTVKDVALTLGTGTFIGLGEALVGLADLVPDLSQGITKPRFGTAGKALEQYTGYSPEMTRAFLATFYTEKTKQAIANQAGATPKLTDDQVSRIAELVEGGADPAEAALEVTSDPTLADSIRGMVDKAATAIANPRVIGKAVGESLPLMAAGAAGARQLIARGLSPALSAAIGEGTVAGLTAVESTRQEDPTGTLTPGQTALAAGSGAVTGAIAFAGATLANKLGFTDIDTLMAGAVSDPVPQRTFVRSMLELVYAQGSEGMEEFGQSIQETVASNLALGKPIWEGVDEAAAMGFITGGLMGGGGQAVTYTRGLLGGAQPTPAPTEEPPATEAAPEVPVVAPEPPGEPPAAGSVVVTEPETDVEVAVIEPEAGQNWVQDQLDRGYTEGVITELATQALARGLNPTDFATVEDLRTELAPAAPEVVEGAEPAAPATEEAGVAEYGFYWTDLEEHTYQIVSGEHAGSSVPASRLAELGIEIPETSPEGLALEQKTIADREAKDALGVDEPVVEEPGLPGVPGVPEVPTIPVATPAAPVVAPEQPTTEWPRLTKAERGVANAAALSTPRSAEDILGRYRKKAGVSRGGQRALDALVAQGWLAETVVDGEPHYTRRRPAKVKKARKVPEKAIRDPYPEVEAAALTPKERAAVGRVLTALEANLGFSKHNYDDEGNFIGGGAPNAPIVGELTQGLGDFTGDQLETGVRNFLETGERSAASDRAVNLIRTKPDSFAGALAPESPLAPEPAVAPADLPSSEEVSDELRALPLDQLQDQVGQMRRGYDELDSAGRGLVDQASAILEERQAAEGAPPSADLLDEPAPPFPFEAAETTEEDVALPGMEQGADVLNQPSAPLVDDVPFSLTSEAGPVKEHQDKLFDLEVDSLRAETLADREGVQVTAESIPFAAYDVERMVERVWGNNNVRDFYSEEDDGPKTWRQWIEQEGSTDEIALNLDSDAEVHELYLRHLPDGVTAWDLVDALQRGVLPRQRPTSAPARVTTPALELEDIPVKSTRRIGEPQSPMTTRTLRNNWRVARQRPVKGSQARVIAARKNILLQAHQQDITGTLGITQAQLNKQLRSWAAYPARARQRSEQLNRNVPAVSVWTGIEQLSFLNRATVNEGDVFGMVKSLEGPAGKWGSNTADTLRRYVTRVFLGLDTRVDFSDLTLRIVQEIERLGDIKPAGVYRGTDTLIEIKSNSDHTVAHEIGHYLDDKWGRELGQSGSYVSSPYLRVGEAEAAKTSPQRVQWALRMNEFIRDLGDRADVSSEYLQRRQEVFARFFDYFIRWAERQAGSRYVSPVDDYYRGDKFTDGDYQRFVKLMQEKAYVDALDGNPLADTPSTKADIAQPDAAAPRWHSQAARTVSAKVPKRASVEQVRNILGNPQNRVKQDELDWLGLDTWLAGKKSVSRQELLDFIAANELVLEETDLTDKPETYNGRTAEEWDDAVNRAEGARNEAQANDPVGKARDEVWERYRPLIEKAADENSAASVAAMVPPTQLTPEARDNYERARDHLALLERERMRVANEAGEKITPGPALEAAIDALDAARGDRAAAFAELADRDASKPKFGPGVHPTLNVPGGKNYREKLVRMPLAKTIGLQVSDTEYSKPGSISMMVDYADQRRPGAGLTGYVNEVPPGSAYLDENDRSMVPGDMGTALFRANFRMDEKSFYYRPDEFDDRHGMATREEAKQSALDWVRRQMDEHAPHVAETAGFDKSHWAQRNVVGHTRVDDRVLPDGRAMYFLQEVQSDWHQTGRDKGYMPKPGGEPRGQWEVFEPRSGKSVGFFETESEAEDAVVTAALETGLGHDYSRSGEEMDERVPEAPFKKTWHELLLKRSLMDAVESGADVIGWTNGQQQADRYNLSTHINRLMWNDATDDGSRRDDQGLLSAWDKTGEVVFSRAMSEGEVGSFVGKEVTQKLLEQERDPSRLHVRQLEGLELVVGGEGMKGFYDKMLPAFMKKYVKKWGSSVERIPLDVSPDIFFTVVDKDAASDDDYMGGPFRTRAEAEATESRLLSQGLEVKIRQVGGPKASDNVWAVTITPQMRESLTTEGQPLFDKPITRQELLALAEKNGTTFEAEVARARSAGYEVAEGIVDGPEATVFVDENDEVLKPKKTPTVDEVSQMLEDGFEWDEAAKSWKRPLTPEAIRIAELIQSRAAEMRTPVTVPRAPDLFTVPTGKIPKARLLKWESLKTMPEDVAAEVVAVMAEHGGFEEQRRGVQSWERTAELAKDVHLPIKTLRPGTALNAEEAKAYDTAIASIQTERIRLMAIMETGDATVKDQLRFSQLTDAATVLVASYRGASAEAGRTLNSFKAKSAILNTPDLNFLKAAMRMPGFKGDLAKTSQLMKDAGTDPVKQLDLLVQRSEGSWFDWIQSVYMTWILSGIKTQLRNMFGNTFNALAEVALPAAAGPIDALRSSITGSERQVFTREAMHGVAGGWAGLKLGLPAALFTIRHGFRPSEVAKMTSEGQFDVRRTELRGPITAYRARKGAKGPVKPGRVEKLESLIFNAPGRFLEAGDEFFRAIHESIELRTATYAEARKAGLSDQTKIAEFMAELEAGGTARMTEIRAEAKMRAARGVFQDQPGAVVDFFMKAKNPDNPLILRAAAMFLAPFMRTPGGIMRQGFEFSPFGFAMAQARGAERMGVPTSPRQQSQALGRAAMGSGLLVPLAFYAAAQGLSGGPPDKQGEREMFYNTGKLTNAIRILGPGGRHYWVRYVLFQPFSVPMAAMAEGFKAWTQAGADEDALPEAVTAAVFGAGASIMDQSFMSGLTSFQNALNDPERRAESWLEYFSTGFVPWSGLMRNVSQSADPVLRNPEGPLEAMQAIVPGLSQNIPPRLRWSGEAATRAGGWFARGFFVPQVSREIRSDVLVTLERLKVYPTTSKATYSRGGEPIVTTREDKLTVAQAVGFERRWELERTMGKPSFQRLLEQGKDEDAEALVRKALASASRTVRANLVKEVDRGRELGLNTLMSRRAFAHVENPDLDLDERQYQETP